MASLRVAVVGSGFAGSILARTLRRQGHEVVMLERGTHPRFALGESSTPLAAICLERLAQRYGLEDLHHMAAYGRWLAHMPEVRRGLKRGFTFYAHQPGQRFHNDCRNSRRLLVAASPHDAAADTHWLREDVDHFLVGRAEAEGVGYQDEVELQGVQRRGGGFHLTGERRGRPVAVTADVVVDASGGAGFLARHLRIGSRLGTVRLRTGLVFSHFEGMPPFAEVAAADGAELPPGPYPDDRAAVHHLLEEGWMYVLPFDHGVASAGIVFERAVTARAFAGLPAEAIWQRVLGRYPTLKRQFAAARPLRPVSAMPRLQRRLARAAGPNWALLPHAYCFLSPLFSTGIAWSLLGVERLALLFEQAAERRAGLGQLGTGLARYAGLLETEANHVQRLIEGTYRARLDFDVFAAYSYLYFAAVSFAEAAQRLRPAAPASRAWAWEGFAGSTDPVMRKAIREAANLLRGRRLPGGTADFANRYFDVIRRSIARRNVAGLANPERHRLYAVDFNALLSQAHLIGLTPDAVRLALPRLRGAA